MKYGAFYFPTDYGIDVRELAREMEARGFDSLYFPEHTHIPTSRRSAFPGGGDLPKRYAHTHDPFVACTAAAAATEKLVLGTGICLVPQHEPIALAKAVASLDYFSNGRFVFGIGGGWNVEEMEHHGVRYKTRFAQMKEHILAMKALWTEEEASFEGKFVTLEPSWSYPKPITKPHPPILLGGESDYTLKRVVDYCDGWFPRAGQGFVAADAMARLKRFADEAGRDMSELTVIIFRAPAERATLDGYREADVDSALFEVPDGSRDEILAKLDEYAKLIA